MCFQNKYRTRTNLERINPELEKNWNGFKIYLTIGGREVERESSKTNLTSIALLSNEYCIEVEYRVDASFMTLVVTAMDELYHD